MRPQQAEQLDVSVVLELETNTTPPLNIGIRAMQRWRAG